MFKKFNEAQQQSGRTTLSDQDLQMKTELSSPQPITLDMPLQMPAKEGENVANATTIKDFLSSQLQ